MQTAIIPERLARLPDITLKSGNSAENEARMCVMEAVAYVAGEPWSDHPKCACPVITAFMVRGMTACRAMPSATACWPR